MPCVGRTPRHTIAALSYAPSVDVTPSNWTNMGIKCFHINFQLTVYHSFEFSDNFISFIHSFIHSLTAKAHTNGGGYHHLTPHCTPTLPFGQVLSLRGVPQSEFLSADEALKDYASNSRKSFTTSSRSPFFFPVSFPTPVTHAFAASVAPNVFQTHPPSRSPSMSVLFSGQPLEGTVTKQMNLFKELRRELRMDRDGLMGVGEEGMDEIYENIDECLEGVRE